MGKRKPKVRKETATKASFRFLPNKDLLIIVAVAAVFRVIYDIELANSVFLNNYVLDSLVLHKWAQDILAGNAADLPFFRAPLYPYILAATYKLFSVSPWSIIFVQNILGILTAAITYIFASHLFNRRIALRAGIVTSVYPTLIYFEGETMITTFAVFLYTLTVFLMYLAIKNPSTRRVLLAGLVLGLAAITRPTILPLAVIFPVAFLVKHKLAALKLAGLKTLVFASAIMIPIVPVTLANFLGGDEFVLISTQGGVNFYIGNAANADGISVVSPGPNLRIGKYRDNIWSSSVDEAKFRTGREMSQGEISSFWLREAVTEIRSDFGRWSRLYLSKVYFFWHGQEIFNNKPLYFASEHSRLIGISVWKKLVNFPTGILFPLMFLGILLAVRERRDVVVPVLFLILFSLVIAMFFVCARFRQPILPLAIMFAAYSVEAMIRQFKAAPMQTLISVLAVIVLAVGLNWGGNIESEQNQSQFHMILGSNHLSRNEYSPASIEFEKSLQLSPRNLGVFDQLGQSYIGLNRLDKAQNIYERGLEIFPTYPLFNFGLGRAHHMQGRTTDAKKHYQAAIENSPEYAPAYDRLAFIYRNEGQLDSAIFNYEKLLELQGYNPALQIEIERLKSQHGPAGDKN